MLSGALRLAGPPKLAVCVSSKPARARMSADELSTSASKAPASATHARRRSSQ